MLWFIFLCQNFPNGNTISSV